MNKIISESINHWNVIFDPYGFIHDKNWLQQAEKTEDILQIKRIYGHLLIDVGYYSVIFKALLIAGEDWENPIEVHESESGTTINNAISKWLNKYKNG